MHLSPSSVIRSLTLHLLGLVLLATLHVALDDRSALATVMPVAVVRTVRRTRREVAAAAVDWLTPMAGTAVSEDLNACTR